MNIPETQVRYLGPDQYNVGAHWLVLRCPFCGKRHTHGAGIARIRDTLGIRHSHCVQGGQYRLQPDTTDAATRVAMNP